MKLNRILKLVSIAFITLLAIVACESKAGNKSDQTNEIMLALLNSNSANSEARLTCNAAVVKMNQCIGAGSGFNPAVMCSDANLNQGDSTITPAKTSVEVYKALISCIDGQIATTNCNFTQNKVASAVQAKQAFFSVCDAPAGLINTMF